MSDRLGSPRAGRAALAHFLPPWATPAIVLLYALSVLGEAIRDRRDLRGRER